MTAQGTAPGREQRCAGAPGPDRADRLRPRAPARRLAGAAAGLVRRWRGVRRPVRRHGHGRRVAGRQPLLWVLALGLIALAVWQAAEVFRWRSGWSASGKGARRRAQVRQRAGQGRPLRGPGGAGDPLRHRRPEVEPAVAAGRRRPASSTGRAGSSWSGSPGWCSSVGAWHVRKGSTSTSSSRSTPPGRRRPRSGSSPGSGRSAFGKGLALAGVGVLLIWAAVTFDPSKAQGLDGALRDPRAAVRPDPAHPRR